MKPPPPAPPPIQLSRPLVAYLSDFDSLGLITMKFNQPLVHDSSRRRLQTLDPASLFDLSMEVGNYEGSENFNKSKLDFVWEVVKSGDIRGAEFYQFQVNYTEAQFVHAGIDPDKIVIKFKDVSMFKTEEGGTVSKVLKSPAPKQMPNTAASRNFDKGTKSAGYALNWSMICCVIIN